MRSIVDPAQIRALLLDIEGTTTAFNFVYKTLFPYARAHLAEFLAQHYGNQDFAADFEALRRDHTADLREGSCPPWRDESRAAAIASIHAYVNWLMDHDRKSTVLKRIQGRIWEAGYRSGELRSHVYPDVPPALKRWRRASLAIGIFSSGSILAQQLLFAHTCKGDLRPCIGSYFDTTTGPKTAPPSYRKIADSLGVPPAAILFVSDSTAELDAASTAGTKTCLCQRSEGSDRESHGHAVIHTFAEVLP